MGKNYKRLKIEKLFRITSPFNFICSAAVMLLIVIMGLFFVCELLKNISFFNTGIENNEEYIVYGEIITGILLIVGMSIPVYLEKKYIKYNSFEDYLTQLNNIDRLDYYEYISFLHLLEHYLTEDGNDCYWLEKKICGHYRWKDGEMLYGIIRKYYNPLDANRILLFLKNVNLMGCSNDNQLLEEVFNKQFKMQIDYKTYKDKFSGIYVDRTRRVIESGFLVLLILSFLSDNSIDGTIILNALAIFLLVWDLCGFIKR